MRSIQKSVLAIAFMLAANIAQAQADIKVDINKSTDSGGWYTNPIIWIVGAAIFILLLVALLRSGKKD
jgi:hypothetical protein